MSGRKRWPTELRRSVRYRPSYVSRQSGTKNQPCHGRHRFHNGARFEWLLRFAAITSVVADENSLDYEPSVIRRVFTEVSYNQQRQAPPNVKGPLRDPAI